MHDVVLGSGLAGGKEGEDLGRPSAGVARNPWEFHVWRNEEHAEIDVERGSDAFGPVTAEPGASALDEMTDCRALGDRHNGEIGE